MDSLFAIYENFECFPCRFIVHLVIDWLYKGVCKPFGLYKFIKSPNKTPLM